MSEPASKTEQIKAPGEPAVDEPIAVSEVVSDSVRSVTSRLKSLEVENRVLRNGWVIYAVDFLGPDVAVRPAPDDDRAQDPFLTACAVWKISEGGYRWIRPIVEELNRRYEHIDFDYRPEKGTVWALRELGSDEIFAEQTLEAMWQLADGCAEAWRQIAALGLGRRFHSAWLSEDLMHGARTLAQVRRELQASGGPSAVTAA
jgi:hypothetical protein